MRREFHVRFCEGLGVRFPRATRRNIFVRSERAGQRVMNSVRRFLSRRLRLQVNEQKSAVARPWTRHFLGFRVGGPAGKPWIRLSERSVRRLRERVRSLTRRTAGRSLKSLIHDLNSYLRGWMGYFRPCTRQVLSELRHVDSHIRRRLRAIVIRHKKRPCYLYRHLLALGVPRVHAARTAFSRRGYWRRSRSRGMHQGYPIRAFEALGLMSLVQAWQHYHRAPQPTGSP